MSELQNFSAFKAYVKRHGFSLSNFYDVDFELTNSTTSLKNILSRTLVGGAQVGGDIQTLMKLYAEECTIPGYQLSTGEYRLTNTPQLKYAYGLVNNEITFSFILDGNSEIRKVFDSWQNYIYTGVSTNNLEQPANLTLNSNSVVQLGRTRYRDDYVSDIIVKKYERYASNYRINATLNKDDPTSTAKFHRVKDIIPDSSSEESSLFGKAVATYSVRLKNAFPTNISSMALSSGSSQLLKLQVTFEYELAMSSAVTGGTTGRPIPNIIDGVPAIT